METYKINKDYNKFENTKRTLEVSGRKYELFFSNETIKKADREGFLKIIREAKSSLDIYENIFYYASIEYNKDITLNLSKKIVENIMNDESYDFNSIFSTLIEDFTKAYENVFTSRGKKTFC